MSIFYVFTILVNGIHGKYKNEKKWVKMSEVQMELASLLAEPGRITTYSQ